MATNPKKKAPGRSDKSRVVRPDSHDAAKPPAISTDDKKELQTNILQLLTQPGDLRDLISKIVLLIKDFSGCEAVGIRLKEGDDYPYYEANGFIDGHVQLENRLCGYDDQGQVVRDFTGNPVLDCMCGNIIQGRFDPAQPFFSDGGSFWSNCTTGLLATTTKKDRKARTRNRCNGEGYESVALIPLWGEAGNIGLLQLNDKRPNRFTPDLIKFYESLGLSIGVVLARKQAQEALQQSEGLYHSLFENMLNGFAYCKMLYQNGQPADFIYLAVNRAFETQTGLQNVTGRKVSEVIPGIREADPQLFEIYGRVAQTGKPEKFETWVGSLGQWFDVSVYSPQKEYFVAVFDVITETKRIHESLRQSEEKYRLIIENSKDIIFTLDSGRNFTYISPSIKTVLGYNPEDLLGQNNEALIHPLDLPRLVEIMRKNIEKDIQTQDTVYRVRHASGEWRWHTATGNAVRNQAGEAISFVVVAHDITERLRMEAEREQYVSRLKGTVEGAIAALASTAETRDPYTAGHQRRVAQLAVAIAREMGHEPEILEAIRVAASLHDIGKIQIPSDILSKPGKLSSLEKEIIKTHPEASYNIVNNIEMPWAIGPMVHQHHERLDGSGYPKGLKGDAIVQEARIIAVADVVEAMVSHRPYRPAHNLATALQEIQQNQGILYDAEAVKACIMLFNEKGFTFSE